MKDLRNKDIIGEYLVYVDENSYSYSGTWADEIVEAETARYIRCYGQQIS